MLPLWIWSPPSRPPIVASKWPLVWPLCWCQSAVKCIGLCAFLRSSLHLLTCSGLLRPFALRRCPAFAVQLSRAARSHDGIIQNRASEQINSHQTYWGAGSHFFVHMTQGMPLLAQGASSRRKNNSGLFRWQGEDKVVAEQQRSRFSSASCRYMEQIAPVCVLCLCMSFPVWVIWIS